MLRTTDVFKEGGQGMGLGTTLAGWDIIVKKLKPVPKQGAIVSNSLHAWWESRKVTCSSGFCFFKWANKENGIYHVGLMRSRGTLCSKD